MKVYRKVMVLIVIGLILTAIELMIYMQAGGFTKKITYFESQDSESYNYVRGEFTDNKLIYNSTDGNGVIEIYFDDVYQRNISEIKFQEGVEVRVLGADLVSYDNEIIKLARLQNPDLAPYGLITYKILVNGANSAFQIYALIFLLVNLLGINLLMMNENRIKKTFRFFIKGGEVTLLHWLMFKGLGAVLILRIFYDVAKYL